MSGQPVSVEIRTLMSTLPDALAEAVAAMPWEISGWRFEIGGTDMTALLRLPEGTPGSPDDALGVIEWRGGELVRFSLMPTDDGTGWTEWYAEDWKAKA